MEANNNTMFGLESFEKLAEQELKKLEDNYVLLVHWFLSSNNYKCIGVGDAKEFSGDEKSSELLPKNWSDGEVYRLRYLREKKLFLLRATKCSPDLIINFIRAEDMKTSTVIIENVAALDEEEQKVDLVTRLHKELIEPFCDTIKNTKKLKTTSTPESPPREERGLSPRYYPIIGPSPLPVGRADVDPFAANMGFGGGMLLPMPGGSRLNNTGIRYDPTLPPGFPGRGGRRRLPGDPDPDDLFPDNRFGDPFM